MEKRPSEVVIMLGGNMENTRHLFTQSIELIASTVGQIKKVSSIYITEPWGEFNQADFLNQAVKFQTLIEPFELLHTLLNIETAFGRKRSVKNGPRTLDIDIIYYNDLIINEINLQIPHPRLHLRRFNLVPLYEISPEWIHPVYNQTVKEMLENCPDSLKVSLDSSY